MKKLLLVGAACLGMAAVITLTPSCSSTAHADDSGTNVLAADPDPGQPVWDGKAAGCACYCYPSYGSGISSMVWSNQWNYTRVWNGYSPLPILGSGHVYVHFTEAFGCSPAYASGCSITFKCKTNEPIQVRKLMPPRCNGMEFDIFYDCSNCTFQVGATIPNWCPGYTTNGLWLPILDGTFTNAPVQ